MVDLGWALGGVPSSAPLIKFGPNRGRRQRESAGRWLYLAGYTDDATGDVKRAHKEWARNLQRSGIRVGRAQLDGVVSYYRWAKA